MGKRMKLYLDNRTDTSIEDLKADFKSLTLLEEKRFEVSVFDLIEQDLDNIYSQVIKNDTINFYIRSPQQISFLAKQISQDFDAHHSTLRLSLSELLMNSLEHGNLRIDSNTKNEMITNGNYYDLIEHLIETNNSKFIEVKYKFTHPKSITITDQGDGFHYQDYLRRADLAENEAYSGRGIQIASIELPKNKATFQYFEKGKKLIINFE